MIQCFDIYAEAVSLGLRLEPRGDKLAVIPAGLVPVDFKGVLQYHKPELMEWLKDKERGIISLSA